MFFKKIQNPLALLLPSILILGCNKDYHPVGESLFENQIFSTSSLNVSVSTEQQQLDFFQADGLPLAQLGKIEQPIFGLSEASFTTQFSINATPRFGIYSQTAEDEGSETDIKIIPEEETVTSVFLEIPFFNNSSDDDNDGVINAFDVDPNDNQSDSDGDGISDILETQGGLNPLSEDTDGDGILDDEDTDNEGYDTENSVYQIDSIYGNRNATFNLKVYELTYYLNGLDADNNFETPQKYYSNEDYFENGFYGEVLHDAEIQLNFDELRFNYLEDDEETPDEDETEQVETRLTPRIRVPLDNNFFQTRFIDMEGTPELSSLAAMQQYLKGLIIRTDNFSDDLYMLLDIANAEIKVNYDYLEYNVKGTTDDTSDDTIDTVQKTYSLTLGGVQLNTLKNTVADGTVSVAVNAAQRGESNNRVYLKGGDLHSVITLFEGEEQLEEFRGRSWLINEANLFFYVAPESDVLVQEGFFADRIYLYNIQDGNTLSDYELDGYLSNESIKKNKQNFGGILEYDDSGNPYRYKFNITDHVSKIIRKDSTNVDLGLVVTGNINSRVIKRGILTSDQQPVKYPRASIINPSGIVLFGANPEEPYADKKIQLELLYTEF